MHAFHTHGAEIRALFVALSKYFKSMCCVGTSSCVLHKKTQLPGKAVIGTATRHSWVFSLMRGSLGGEIQFSIHKHAVPAYRKLGLAGCKCLRPLGRYLST